jgi:bilin biosynthesis protein
MKSFNSPRLFIWLIFISSVFNCTWKSPSEEQIKAFRSAKTVKIMVNQSYGSVENVYLPYKEITQKLCESAGLKIISNDTADYHLLINIHSSGRAKGKWYEHRDQYPPRTREGRGYHYTGAEIKGVISLSYKGMVNYSKNFSSKVKPPSKIYSKSYSEYIDPSSAPFEKAFRKSDSFISKLFELASDIYGHDCLIPFLEQETHEEYGGQILTPMGYQHRAIDTFIKIGEPAISSLIKAIHHDNREIRYNASKSLGLIGKTAVDTLLVTILDGDPIVRSHAAYALGLTKNRKAFDFLCVSLKDEHSGVRSSSAEALGYLKDPRAIEPLVWAAQKDTNSSVKRKSIESLSKLGNSGIKALEGILEDKESDILYEVATVLNQMDWIPKNNVQKYNYNLVLGNDSFLSPLGKVAIEDLIESLNSKEELRRTSAALTLKRMCKQDFGANYKDWNEWWNQNKHTF